MDDGARVVVFTGEGRGFWAVVIVPAKGVA